MNKTLASLGFAVSLMLSLAACHRGPTEPAPLQGAAIGGPFTLTDQNGKSFSSDALAGKYRVIYFGYTFCPDACPTDMAVLGKAMRMLDQKDPTKSTRIQPIFITVDPARDTPPVLKQFVAAFHPRLIGLTGSEAQIAAVAKEYAVSYRKQPAPEGASGYLMDHPRIAILLGPDGKPIELLPVDANADAVVTELEKWVI
jgi:protein SCO1